MTTSLPADPTPTSAEPSASPAPPPPPALPMTPLPAAQRIEALDVVRGFALLGIFLMNIEWFSRPFTSFGEGMPRGLTGLNWLASWFIAYFVQGKFWTIFSLVFGMGFAVMLLRAEQTGREFKRVYLRRVLALGVFGAGHFIFLWDGDILFTYAVSALMLMVVLYGRPKPLLGAIAVAVGLGAALDAQGFFGVAAGLALAGLLALFMRSEKKPLRVPLFAFLLLLLGLGLSAGAAALWVLPDAPLEPRLPLTVFGPLTLLMAALAWRYHQPPEKRALRMGATLYLFAATAMTLMGAVQYFGPDPLALPAKPAAATASAPAAAKPPASAASGAEKKKTREERVAEAKAEREKRLKEQAEEKALEIKTFTTGSYGDAVDYRARRFLEKAAGDFGASVLFIGMFLLGAWFVRSGVMERTQDHLPLFRRLALWGLPLGIGLGLAGSLIAMHHTPGDRHDGWLMAQGLVMLGNLPACLGYVGLVVLMLHGGPLVSRIRVLAPMGRMALTNYLTQSLICALYFHGYAFGQWGMPRAWQVVFVLVVFAAQLAFSHWWMARFRYGPVEWLWRGFTYRELPRLRV